MLTTRRRQLSLLTPMLVAALGILCAVAALHGMKEQADTQIDLAIIALYIGLTALGVSIGQIIWHLRRSSTERISRTKRIAELQHAMDTVSDGVIVYDNDWRFTFLNRSAVHVASKPVEELLGKSLWEVYPELVGTDLHARYLESQRTQSEVGFEFFTAPTSQWLEIRLFPSAERITIVFRDISDQHATLEKLEEANEGIAQQLRRTEEVAGSLRESNRQLGESNRQLQELAHIASHDLQEPVRKIRIFGQMLREHSEALGESGKDYLGRMLGATARLQSLISSLMAFARVGANRPAEVSVDFHQLVADVLADFVAGENIEPPSVTVGKLPAVVGDPVLLRQVIQNLISNSVKFSKAGERAKIEISGETFQAGASGADWCRIILRDHGIGFDPAESERIFDLFRRLHGRSSYEGSGIGLAIVRRVIEHHGGRVRAAGTPGGGATFEIEMPVTPAPASELAEAGKREAQ